MEIVWSDKLVVSPVPVARVEPIETVGSGRRVSGRLYHGDNLSILHELLRQESRLHMIYLDPPFEVGSDFYIRLNGRMKLAYEDKWLGDAYLRMMYPRLQAIHRLLRDDGCICFHCDWRLNSRIRLLLDEIFGEDNYVNEIIWSYRSGGASRKGSLPRKHDSILLYRKSRRFTIHPILERQYLGKPFMGSRRDEAGRWYVDTLLRDVWEGVILTVDRKDLVSYNTRPVLNVSSERIGYPTQKPIGLLKLLIRLTTKPGDRVGDFFSGSGTTLSAAESTGRQWVGCDRGAIAVHVAWKRLLSQRTPGAGTWQLWGPEPLSRNPMEWARCDGQLRCGKTRSRSIDYVAIDERYDGEFRNRTSWIRSTGTTLPTKWMLKSKKGERCAVDVVDRYGKRTRTIL